jgi:hypothetical protein
MRVRRRHVDRIHAAGVDRATPNKERSPIETLLIRACFGPLLEPLGFAATDDDGDGKAEFAVLFRRPGEGGDHGDFLVVSGVIDRQMKPALRLEVGSYRSTGNYATGGEEISPTYVAEHLKTSWLLFVPVGPRVFPYEGRDELEAQLRGLRTYAEIHLVPWLDAPTGHRF